MANQFIRVMILKDVVIIYGVLILFYGVSDCLRDLHVHIPEAVATGEAAVLYCSYNLEHDQLYSFKWYKNKDEFFRYIPKELPHTKYFPLPALNVDRHRSSIRSLILRNVQPSISDWYRCEVIADAPTYRTLVKSAYMHVIDVPKESPRLVIEKKQQTIIGESLKVFCLSPVAQPAPNITWKLNGVPIKATKTSYVSIEKFVTSSGNLSELDRHINEIEKYQKNPNNIGMEERRTVSLLVLKINEMLRRHKPMNLTCTTEIFHLYSKKVDVSIVTVDGETPSSGNFVVVASSFGADTMEHPNSLQWIMAMFILGFC